MNIRPYISVVLLSAVLAVSCRDTEAVEEIPIGMSAVTHSTRSGAIKDVDDFNAQGSFGVYGYKTVASYARIFTDQQVNYNSTATSWDYTPIKYWDSNGYYYFGAYAPYFGTTASDAAPYLTHNSPTSGDVDHILTVNNFPNWQWWKVSYNTSTDDFTTSDNSGCNDLQYAYSKGLAQDYITSYNGYVNFTFYHALSWLEVQVSCPSLADNAAVNYYITGLTIGNDPAFTPHDNCDVPDGAGKFTYSLNYTSQSDAYGTPGGTNGYATLYPAVTDQSLKLTKTDQLLCSNLCVPFKVTGEGIYLNMTYNTGSGSSNTQRSVAIPLSDTENLKELEAGKKYLVKLRFEMGEPLKVVKVYINDWNTTGGRTEHPLFNW